MFLSACAGQALMEVGESYKQLAEIKYSMEDTVKQNFLEPLQSLQSKDLKEVNVCIHLHKCTGTHCLFSQHYLFIFPSYATFGHVPPKRLF